jgi:hypothetical protein
MRQRHSSNLLLVAWPDGRLTARFTVHADPSIYRGLHDSRFADVPVSRARQDAVVFAGDIADLGSGGPMLGLKQAPSSRECKTLKINDIPSCLWKYTTLSGICTALVIGDLFNRHIYTA